MSKNGRPRKDLTSRQLHQLEKLAGFGLTQDQIADFFGLSDRTLRRRISEDDAVLAHYQRGKAKVIAAVAGSLIRDAMAGKDVAGRIFFLKTQAGWRERDEIELRTPDGSGLLLTVVPKRDDAALKQIPPAASR